MGRKRTEVDREHFDRIAAGYVDKDLVPSSRCARRLRLERLFSRVPLQPTWRVLEVGCGAGFAATYLRGRYGSYLGCDHSRELIRAAVAHNSGPNVEFVCTNIADLPEIERVDLVFMVGVLHHLEDRANVMARLRSLLRPGGYLAVNEPQPSNPVISTVRRIRASVDTSYSDDQDEIAFDELHRLFVSAGLIDIEIVPQGLFSTPFAEVPMRPDWLVTPIAKAACFADAALEPRLAAFLGSMTWNLSAVGRCPEGPATGIPDSEGDEG